MENPLQKSVDIFLSKKQTLAFEAYENPLITELGYGGAAYGGKTRLGWYLVISLCEAYADAKIVVGRKELKTLRLTTLAELWTIFNELHYVEKKDYWFNASDNIITFASGSEVLCLDTAYSPQDPEYTRFGSLPVTLGWIDESNETPWKAKAILRTRIGRANELHKVIYTLDKKTGKYITSKSKETYTVKGFWLETFNPNKGDVYRNYYKPWKTHTLPPYREFIRALPGDNIKPNPQYMQNLERADKITKERLLNGNFEYDADPQKIMVYDSIVDLPTNVLTPRTKQLPDGTIVADPTKDNIKTMICDVARFGGDKIVIGTFKGLWLYSLGVYTYQGTDETVQKMKQEAIEESVPYGNILADEDGVGGGVVDNMRGIKGFHGNASPTFVWDFIKVKKLSANFQNFRSQCYFKLADFVNDHQIKVNITKFQTNIEGFTAEQALEELFEELDSIKETDAPKKTIIPKIEIKEVLGRSPDFADVLMMRMFYELSDAPEEENPAYYIQQNIRQTKINPAR